MLEGLEYHVIVIGAWVNVKSPIDEKWISSMLPINSLLDALGQSFFQQISSTDSQILGATMIIEESSYKVDAACDFL
jgi:hypothetical protein